MSDTSFRLRELDKTNAPQVFEVVLASVFVSLLWYSCKAACAIFFWEYWAMIWLPVALSYLVTSLSQKSQQKVTTLQRVMALLLAGVLNIIIGFITEDDSESAGELMLFYIFIFIPVQLVLVLVIDILLYCIKRLKKRDGRSP